jgi:hypothetical protein
VENDAASRAQPALGVTPTGISASFIEAVVGKAINAASSFLDKLDLNEVFVRRFWPFPASPTPLRGGVRQMPPPLSDKKDC